MATWDQIRAGIFAGESGGDYDALYGYRNRQSGPFGNVRVSQMPLRDVLAFTDPQGAYAQSVKGEIGRVATPVGAYQVVGSTLRDAVRGLGLTGDEMFDQATQDRIGRWIYENQGVGAWEGYRGPQPGGMNTPQAVARDTRAALGYGGQQQVSTRGPAPMMPPREQPQGLLQMLGIQPRGEGPQGDRPFYQRDQFRDMAGRLAVAANSLRQRPDQNIPQMVQGNRMQREANRTAEWLGQQEGGAEFAQAILNGANPGEVLMAYRQSRQPVAPEQTAAMQNYQFLVAQGMDPATAMERAFSGGVTVQTGSQGPQVGTIPQGYQLVQDPQTGAYRMEPVPGGPADTSGQAAAAAEGTAAGSVNVLEKVQDIRDEVENNPFASGILGAIATNIPGTGAYDTAQTAGTVKANLGFDRLSQMRAASPTGGALGSVSQLELDRLESSIASLNLSQSKEQILANLDDIERQYTRILQNAYRTGDPAALDAALGGRPSFISGGGSASSGVNAPPEAVQMLKANPTPAARAQFDEIFGAGAAARVLGQ